MNKPNPHQPDATTSLEALATAKAAELLSKGWRLIAPGDLAKSRAAGDYDLYELASFKTAPHRDARGNVTELYFEIWRRRKSPLDHRPDQAARNGDGNTTP
jgi:hypothetical protein